MATAGAILLFRRNVTRAHKVGVAPVFTIPTRGGLRFLVLELNPIV